MFQAGVDAARALAGRFPPHLRLVDLETTAGMLRGREPQAAREVARLAESLADTGGWLSLEHARQPWTSFTRVMGEARRLLGSRSDHLRLCYDPVNLLFASDRPHPADVIRSLDAASLSMVHLKQLRSGALQTSIGAGEIDWEAQISGLARHGYEGPALFEVRSDQRIWENLDRSRVYLESLGGPFQGLELAMQRVRVGLIGAGWVAVNRHLPALRKIPEADLNLIWSRDPEKARDVAVRFGVRATVSGGGM